jgi:methyl-accepting chemotaxis protein
MLSRFSLRANLLGAFSFFSVLLAVVGGIGIHFQSATTQEFKVVSDQNLPKVMQVNEMKFIAQFYLYHLLQLTIVRDDPKELERISEKIKLDPENYAKTASAYAANDFFPGEEEIYRKMSAEWTEINKDVEIAIPLAKSRDPADQKKLTEFFNGPFLAARLAFYKAADELKAFHTQSAAAHVNDAATAASTGTRLSLLVVLFGFAGAMFAGWYIARFLADTLAGIAAGINGGADSIADASLHLSRSSDSLSASVTEQAAAIEETSSAVEQLNAMVAKNAENAMASNTMSNENIETAGRGKAAVGEMIQSVEDIDQSNQAIMAAVEKNNQNIAEITKVIGDIANKTKVINDIVFQTKLLSFNASVEAARAGEHGKGFAVVAEEVGNLAQMSGRAANEISSMLESSTKKVEEIASETKREVEVLIRQGSEKVQRGKDVAQRCGDTLDEVVRKVEGVNQKIVEISAASKEQATGIQEIAAAMNNLNQATQANSVSSEQTAKSSEQLSGQAGQLRGMVKNLVALVEGGRAETASETRADVAIVKPIRGAKFKGKRAA